ncbi:hypothetical protein Tco_0578717 [Tanacetum coccineum]
MSSSPHSTIIPSDSDINDAIPRPQVIFALPVILPPSPVLSLSPVFDSRDSFPSEKISSPKDTETPISPSSSVGSSSPVRSTTPPPDYPFDKILESCKRHKTQKKQGRTTRLEFSRIQPLDMPPKRTSTSATPTMTQAAIRQLITDGIAAALEAQLATMANINRNCAKEDRVTFATDTLTDDALSWWETLLLQRPQTLGKAVNIDQRLKEQIIKRNSVARNPMITNESLMWR